MPNGMVCLRIESIVMYKAKLYVGSLFEPTLPSCLQSPTPHMCLQPLVVGPELTIMDADPLSVFPSNNIGCISVFEECDIIWLELCKLVLEFYL